MELACKLLVVSEQITNLTAAYTDISGRNVHVRTDYLIQLTHECLAETHNLSVALTAGSKVRTSLTATHRQSGERILECLLETEELQNAKVY